MQYLCRSDTGYRSVMLTSRSYPHQTSCPETCFKAHRCVRVATPDLKQSMAEITPFRQPIRSDGLDFLHRQIVVVPRPSYAWQTFDQGGCNKKLSTNNNTQIKQSCLQTKNCVVVQRIGAAEKIPADLKKNIGTRQQRSPDIELFKGREIRSEVRQSGDGATCEITAENGCRNMLKRSDQQVTAEWVSRRTRDEVNLVDTQTESRMLRSASGDRCRTNDSSLPLRSDQQIGQLRTKNTDLLNFHPCNVSPKDHTSKSISISDDESICMITNGGIGEIGDFSASICSRSEQDHSDCETKFNTTYTRRCSGEEPNVSAESFSRSCLSNSLNCASGTTAPILLTRDLVLKRSPRSVEKLSSAAIKQTLDAMKLRHAFSSSSDSSLSRSSSSRRKLFLASTSGAVADPQHNTTYVVSSTDSTVKLPDLLLKSQPHADDSAIFSCSSQSSTITASAEMNNRRKRAEIQQSDEDAKLPTMVSDEFKQRSRGGFVGHVNTQPAKRRRRSSDCDEQEYSCFNETYIFASSDTDLTDCATNQVCSVSRPSIVVGEMGEVGLKSIAQELSDDSCSSSDVSITSGPSRLDTTTVCNSY